MMTSKWLFSVLAGPDNINTNTPAINVMFMKGIIFNFCCDCVRKIEFRLATNVSCDIESKEFLTPFKTLLHLNKIKYHTSKGIKSKVTVLSPLSDALDLKILPLVYII